MSDRPKAQDAISKNRLSDELSSTESSREPLNERELIDLINQVELLPQSDELSELSASDESIKEQNLMLRGLSEEQQAEVERALSAQRLLAQLAGAQPPDDLPMKTARRARRRRRQELVRPNKTWLDQLLGLAVLLLIVAIISLISHHLRDERMRKRVEQLKVQPHP